MIVDIHRCSECGHDKGHSLAEQGRKSLAECTQCQHLCDALENDIEDTFTQKLRESQRH